jgi:hypothetical protein
VSHLGKKQGKCRAANKKNDIKIKLSLNHTCKILKAALVVDPANM